MTTLCYELPAAKIKLEQNSADSFTVTYWKQVEEGLTYNDAATELGACIMHYLACVNKLDNSEELNQRPQNWTKQNDRHAGQTR